MHNPATERPGHKAPELQIDKCHFTTPIYVCMGRWRAKGRKPPYHVGHWGESLRTQMLRKLMGGEGSPWAWSLMGACW